MVFLKILFIELIIVLSVVVALRMWVSAYRKKNELRKQKLLSYLPIKTVPELLKILEAEAQKPKEYYLKTYYITTELHFNDRCLIQGEDNWIVCYADSHAFTDEHYFQTEQEACDFFFHYYFNLF